MLNREHNNLSDTNIACPGQRNQHTEGNVLFNDALNTVIWRQTYGKGPLSKRGNPLPQGFFYMHHPTDRITHTMDFGTPVVEYWLER